MSGVDGGGAHLSTRHAELTWQSIQRGGGFVRGHFRGGIFSLVPGFPHEHLFPDLGPLLRLVRPLWWRSPGIVALLFGSPYVRHARPSCAWE